MRGGQARPEELQIAGLTRLSTCDWPGRLVATAFLQGCPWACTYCHNPELIDPRTPGTVAWSEVRDLIARRHGLLDGVVFSGGEPTRQPALVAAAREVRDAGLGVGLHTGGAYPRRLEAVLPLVDWVGFDVKAPADLYQAVTGVASSARAVERSLRLVLDAGVAVQVRTTVDPTVLSADDVSRLGRALAALGVTDHVLQEVRPQGTRPEYAAALDEVLRSGGRTLVRDLSSAAI
ncbi:anaerobic ribonucleoside-triphosphate reductase activating protein [Actinotalea sp. K2]|uniref:anaerobic ribonucleoside-triphosphate reductase activating protein n=1 Tax=Actinotalea sp. K2 TaxID=2939438 RepID=UPI002017A539|nr:anaerobic ribonucleoside-triphosphate reductase activating protein [Actinotalea sp. K2]MCL3861377.1 anaerobic ribonucleoside-triphosphate reductase activating protein [Actinotalea sp. K2]